MATSRSGSNLSTCMIQSIGRPIDLIPEGAGTLVRLIHRGLPPEDLPLHRAGWDAFLPRLDLAARGLDPGPDPA
jgi:hypothetical protein